VENNMTTPTFTPTDIVNFAIAKDSVNLSAAFDQLVGQRVVDAIQAQKIEVANRMFNQQSDEEEQESSAEDQEDTEAVADEVAVDSDTEQTAEQETEESDEDAKVTS
jgi:hypothetical protein